MSFEISALLVTWAFIVLLAFAMAGLLRQVRILTALVQAPEAPDLGPRRGGRLSRSHDLDLSPEGPSVLVFTDADCTTCRRLLPTLQHLAETRKDLQLIAMFRGASDGFKGTSVRVLENQVSLFERLGIRITPYGMVLSPDGDILESLALGSERGLETLVGAVRREGVKDDA